MWGQGTAWARAAGGVLRTVGQRRGCAHASALTHLGVTLGRVSLGLQSSHTQDTANDWLGADCVMHRGRRENGLDLFGSNDEGTHSQQC